MSRTLEPSVLDQFASHIEGKNATVKVYADRIEWDRPRTFGKKIRGTEMIAVKSMSSVTTKRDGFAYTKVSVITSGNTVDFRVSHADAKQVKDVLTQLILGKHPAQGQAHGPPPAPAAARSFTDRLAEIDALHQQGILTDAEYSDRRTSILSEM